jgi:hypothetical protein
MSEQTIRQINHKLPTISKNQIISPGCLTLRSGITLPNPKESLSKGQRAAGRRSLHTRILASILVMQINKKNNYCMTSCTKSIILSLINQTCLWQRK